MPIHDYVCADCGHAVEVMHSVHRHGPTICPNCGGPMKRTLAAPAVHFKGSGWARKDRSSATKSNRAPSTEAGSSSGEKPVSTSTDSVASSEATSSPKEPD